MGYKVKSAFRPSERKRRELGEVAIDLTPIMNLVVVLIPLLLQVVVFVQIGRIDYEPPPLPAFGDVGGGEGGGGGGGGADLLNLVVNVADSAFQVSIYGAVSGQGYWTIPLTPDGEYDYATLQQVLLKVKTEEVGAPLRTETATDPKTGEQTTKEIYKVEDASIVRIAAKGTLKYHTLVSLLDATRSVMVDNKEQWLFPQPILGQLRTTLIEG
jgi:biopolymer transport protein ExbD